MKPTLLENSQSFFNLVYGGEAHASPFLRILNFSLCMKARHPKPCVWK